MTTIDELLKAHPAPFRAIPLYGHYGQPQFQVCDKDGYSIAHAWGQDAQDICDAMNELVRLREVHAKQTPLFWEANAEVMRLRDSSMVQTHLRMAEKLEKAEAERDALKTRNAELEAFAERMKGAPGRLADALDFGHLDAAIYGEGPLPWDEKGGGA